MKSSASLPLQPSQGIVLCEVFSWAVQEALISKRPDMSQTFAPNFTSATVQGALGALGQNVVPPQVQPPPVYQHPKPKMRDSK